MPSPNRALRVALLGAGYQGEKYIPELIDLAREGTIRFSGIAEIAQSKTDSLRLRGIRTTTSHRDLIATSDAAIVCTPNSSHYEIALEWLEAGKHVLVEKPVTTSHAEAEKLLEAARLNDVFVMPGHIYRFSRQLYWVKKTIDDGKLGKIRAVHMRTITPTRAAHGLGAELFFDLLPHFLDNAHQLFGSLPSFSSKIIVPRQAHAFLMYAYDERQGGFPVTVELGWGLPEKHRSLEIMGEKLALSCDMAADPMFVYLTEPLNGKREERWQPANNTMQDQLRAFAHDAFSVDNYSMMEAAVDGLELIEESVV